LPLRRTKIDEEIDTEAWFRAYGRGAKLESLGEIAYAIVWGQGLQGSVPGPCRIGYDLHQVCGLRGQGEVSGQLADVFVWLAWMEALDGFTHLAVHAGTPRGVQILVQRVLNQCVGEGVAAGLALYLMYYRGAFCRFE
jgi:hypothetical protein